jgi:hypothetical protein
VALCAAGPLVAWGAHSATRPEPVLEELTLETARRACQEHFPGNNVEDWDDEGALVLRVSDEQHLGLLAGTHEGRGSLCVVAQGGRRVEKLFAFPETTTLAEAGPDTLLVFRVGDVTVAAGAVFTLVDGFDEELEPYVWDLPEDMTVLNAGVMVGTDGFVAALATSGGFTGDLSLTLSTSDGTQRLVELDERDLAELH